MPARGAAQDSTRTDSIADRPHSIQWWQVGAVAGAAVLTMAVVDAPVQEWSSNPEHGSQTADDFAAGFKYFGAPAVIYPLTGGIILYGLAAKKPASFTAASGSGRRLPWPVW